MAQQSGASAASTAGARLTDAFVIFAVTVVSLALGAWLLLRLGLRVWSGLALALGIYASLLTIHLTLRRIFSSGRGQPADAEEVFDPWAHERTGAPPPGMPPLPSLKLPEQPDPFAFRPADVPSLGLDPLRSLELPPTQPASPPASAGPPPLPLAPEAAAKVAVNAPPEMSVEMIQDLIKKLADELNTAPANPPKVRGKLVPQADTEGMVGRSISALEAAAKTMRATSSQPPAAKPAERAAAAPAPAAAPPAAAPAAPAQAQAQAAPRAAAQPAAAKEPQVNPQLARVAEALAAERMEVLLEPIQSLTEGRTRHFEISTRLLTVDGNAMTQDEVARVAQGSGLMPRMDIARIIRAARVARRLGEGGRAGSVLTAVAGESLTDHRFLSTASNEQGPSQTMRLVISFQQSEVRTFSPGHMQTLAALAAAGFRFALDGVTDLDMDFSNLKRIGFEFVKLDAPVFLEGLPAPAGLVPAADITRMLADNGLTLVVGRIEDDWLLARVLGFGVLYGRGTLFGGPRLVKAEVVAAPNAMASAN